jgi:hypothetical protein
MQIQPVIDHEDQVGHIQEVIEQEVQLIQEDLMEVIVHEDQVIQVIEQADQNLQIPEVVIEQADQVIQVIEQEVQLQPAPNPDLDEDLLPLWWMQMIEGLELGPANLGQLGQIEHVVGQAVVDHVGHIQEDLMEVIVHEDQVIQVIEQEVQLIQEGHNHEDHLPQWMLNMIRQRPVGYINMNLIQMHAYQNQAEEKR